ncbi:MAG: general secretion pathway protein GspB [Gammaproteobacteria bacterium]|jgi:general secretion pathway protein B
MSFILDALKKSETERQGQRGLGVADVPVAREAPKAPPWIWWLLGLLGINLLVLAAVLLRPQPEAGSDRVSRTAEPVSVSAAAESRGRSTVPDTVAPELAAVVDRARAERDRSTASAVQTPPAAPPRVERTATLPPASAEPTRAVQTAPSPPLAEEPPPRPSRATDTAETALELPTLNELRVRGDTSLPDLHLDIHVWSEQPGGRFVYVNSMKYREGEVLSEGPRVASIAREGVVLEYRGNRFLLPRE